jgi:O-antigen/teichoic acid export membrane protein
MLTRFAKHSAWLLLARLWTYVTMAIFTILVARQLGRSGFGEYSFMSAAIVIGNMLTTFGTDMLLIREIAAGKQFKQLYAALVLQLVLSALFIAGIFSLSQLLTFQSYEGGLALSIFSLSLIPLAFFTVFTTALRGKEQMQSYAVLNICLASTQLIAGFILFFERGNLVLLAWLLLLTQGVSALFAGFLCTMKIPDFWKGWQFSVDGLLSLVFASAPIALLGVLSITYQRLVPTMLPILAGALQAGIFSAASRMVEVAKVGHIAMFTAIYPVMAQRKEGHVEWFKSLRPVWLFLLATAAFASLVLSLLAEPLTPLLFGDEFRLSIPLVKIMAWVIPPYTVTMLLSLAFLANGDESVLTNALTVGLLGLAILTIWWGKTAGPYGAAWAVLYAEYIQAGILLFQAVRHFHRVPAN